MTGTAINNDDPVVVVGFSFNFPQNAVSEEGFWDIIHRGISTMTEVPKDRYDINGYHANGHTQHGMLPCRGGHFLKGDVTAFDTQFFSMNVEESKATDPQLRLLLETSYHALESAGIPLESVKGSMTSVFLGSIGSGEYTSLYGADDEINNKYQATGTSMAMLSNRLSWFYDFRGPSLTLDTACSSSLVSLHLACQSLLRGESEMSLVCGAQLQLEPRSLGVQLARLQFLSPDSHCYSFDDRANGYSRGEGVGVVVLKRLSKALEDGDRIRAIIRATASNQDGHTPSVTQPSSIAQASLIRKAYEQIGFDYSSTGYFEAHGTGTTTGDPIEVSGINEVFSAHRTTDNPLFIGSVKANIGHLEASSGIAGLIKAILVLEKGEIPPNALLQRLNPAIKADEWHFKFPTSPLPWPTDGLRRASVNSFGFGGTNAHVILDDAFHYLRSRGVYGCHNTMISGEYLKSPGDVINTACQRLDTRNYYSTDENQKSVLLFPLSASDENGIQRQATALISHLRQVDTDTESKYLRDLAFTLGKRRTFLPWKSFALGSSVQDLMEDSWNQTLSPMHANKSPEVHFVFTGQGAQWPSMGIELIQYPIFKESLQRSNHYFRSLGATWSLLVDLLKSWGITPKSVVGHSSGEIAAAYCTGALTDESAWRVAYFRGEVIRRLAAESYLEQGCMLAVALPESELESYISAVAGTMDSNSLTCSCINSAKNTTVSGKLEHINKLASVLQSKGVFARKLNVPVAYHSAQMLGVASSYKTLLDGYLESQVQESNETRPVYFSSVEGTILSDDALSRADYWVSNLISKVKFSDALQLMCAPPEKAESKGVRPREQAMHCLVELGAHCALERPVKDHIAKRADWAYDYTLRREVSAIRTMKLLAGRIYAKGYPVKLVAVNNHADFQEPPEVLHDLPPYPFNHENSYWLESRLSRNHRFRGNPRHDLLGNPSRDWCPMEPKWRFTIRATDLPWVLDHKIQNTVIYPAAGVTGYRLRDVSVTSALVIPLTDEGIETQLHLHSQGDSQSDRLAQAWNFRFYSVVKDEWKLHCSGQICAEQVDNGDFVSETTNDNHSLGVIDAGFGALRSRCTSIIDHSQYYRDFARKGANFGSSFQTLRNIAVNYRGREATAIVGRDEWDRLVQQQKLTSHVIHPTTLDSLIHVIFAAASADWEHLSSLVPTRFLDIYFSCGLLKDSARQPMHLYGCITGRGIGSVDGDAVAIDNTTSTPLVVIRGCRLNSISSVRSSTESSLKMPSLFHRLEWKPDITLLSSDEIETYCRRKDCDIEHDANRRAFEIVSRHFMSITLEKLDQYLHNNSKPYLQKYVRWVRAFLEREKDTTVELVQYWPGFEDHTLRPRLLEEFASNSEEAKNLVLFGQNLKDILIEELDPLGFLMNQGILESIYKSTLFKVSSARLAAYMDLLAHKTSDIKIIEVGAGTGSGTDLVLDALAHHGRFLGSSTRFSRYDFTDISPSFFAKAQQRYAQHSGSMRFKTLDLERDPVDQGFEAHSYDVVIAISVLHATYSIDNTLTNVKKLLKPGGQLIFIEPTNLRLATVQFLSGVLPGWWLSSEESRSSGPLLTVGDWRSSLLRAGFDGMSLAVSDGAEDIHGLTLMVSTVPSLPSGDTSLSTVIVVETPEQNELAYASTKDQYERCICLLELGQPVMDQMNETQFMSLKRMLQVSRQIMWVNNSCGGDADKPEASMVSGFSKSITRERPNLIFTHINFNMESRASMSASLVRIFGRINDKHPSENETDLLEQNGMMYIPRAIEAPNINALLHEDLHGLQQQSVRVNEGGYQAPLQLQFTPGRLDSLHFVADTQVNLPLGEDEVEVSVKAVGINFKDVMVALNRVTDDHIGQEFSGEVRRVGSAATAYFSPGDRVCGIAAGCYSTYIRARCFNTLRIPKSMPYTEACAVPVAFATAQYGLCHLGQLKFGETILIHAAAGAVGQAAIQIAQHVGATVLVTVSSQEKKQLLMDQYGIPASHFFSSRHTSFALQLMRKTEGKGVDVVLNSLSGRSLQETWRCLAPFGRFIEIGKRDINTFKDLPMEPFERNISFSSVDLAMAMKHNTKLMGQIMAEVGQLVLDEETRKYAAPRPLTVFRQSGLEDAFRSLQTGRHVGKLVVDWAQEDTIQVVDRRQLEYEFDGNATYLIAGGLGGIGRNVAVWMSQHGAKYLVLLSRSGVNSDQAKGLITQLEAEGVNIYAPPCDICDVDALSAVVRFAQDKLPPIKGCIQSSMVVRNRVFSDYSLEEFQASIDPKVKGTWNLHHLLPQGLDFFVILSSLAGVHGASSQSNYAAANSFLDAFARYRHVRGERCMSLDLGIMENIGYIAERIDVAQTLAMTYTDHKYLRECELHFMLKYACNPNPSHVTAPASPWETQLIGAMTTPAFVRRGGIIQDHSWMRMPIFRHLYQMERDTRPGEPQITQEDSAGSQLRAAGTIADAAAVITKLLARRLARSLAIPVDTINTNKPPHSFGVDSLVAVELLHWFSTEIRTDVPVVQILGNKSIAELGLLAAETSEHFVGREKGGD
ncbi:hypothetical protein E0Z10_g3853 [Xylaria hypoxylon]|uniref:Uncharacterized protein n=1 Tax=Xylaria hypoxylon TaxID=37992 RepID=A0A4Z0YM59_9PEZI|nr:hypothetical protein E0Z10_g3853 [Xylaria hypoxylon]